MFSCITTSAETALCENSYKSNYSRVIEIQNKNMKNLREGLRWFEQAEADLKTAKDCLSFKDRKLLRFRIFQPASGRKSAQGFLIRARVQGTRNPLGFGTPEGIVDASKSFQEV